MSDAAVASATVDRTPLEAGIARLIRAGGPIDVATFMALALGHPTQGYYAARAGLGAGGDFVTAPEVSQLFGELVGLSLAAAWAASGTPPAHLVELGPGNGTLMADLWRGTGRVPGFHDALTVHLVETSPRLRAAQATRLASIAGLTWHDDLETLPRDRPLLVVANEFFDALPIRQLVKEDGSWHEVRIDLGPDDRLRLGRAAEPSPLGNLLERGQPDGSVVEISPAREAFMAALAQRLAGQGGLALIIDYGERDPLPGSTLQAVSNHRRVAPLTRPGEVDLTSHVAFGPLIEIARRAGLGAYGPLPQGDFLERLGAGLRLGQLLAGASGATAERLRAGHRRLTHPEAMGELFKVLAVTSWPGLPPGFAASEAS
jgi:NADH dehydrogenase [ubiquinone] 1 alpha subcomplex assembly factor 7